MLVSPSSFAIFVWPFAFARERFDALITAANAEHFIDGSHRVPFWQAARFARDDLLPHVAAYLNPPPGSPTTARLWRLSERALRSPLGLGLGAASILLAGNARQASIPIGVAGLDLVLFSVGVGFLVWRVSPVSDQPADWFDVLHRFRMIDNPRRASLRISLAGEDTEPVPFFPAVAACPDCSQSGQGTVAQLAEGLLRRLVPEDCEEWWRSLYVPGQVIPFHALFFADAPEAAHDMQVLYRLRNFFHSGQELLPPDEELRPDHPALLPFARRMWFSFGLEGGGFVAFDPPETVFWRETMPAFLRSQYFLAFLLALHQRFALMHLSEQVCARWAGSDDARAEAQFADLRDALLAFTARGYFQQVVQRVHQHRCFQAWQQVFGTERLYREVSDEVRELHEMLLMRKTERLQRLAEEQRRLLDAQAQADAARERAAEARSARLGNWFGGFAFMLGVPSLVLSYLQAVGISDPRQVGVAFFGALMAGGLLWGSLHLWLRRATQGD